MQDLNDLFYFVQVIDHGGFTPAGRALGMPKSKLSRRIAALETRLGARLIQRSTRHFSVTDIGSAFYEHAKAMIVEAEAAQGVVAASMVEPCGVIRLSCPIALLHTNVGVMLADFMALYPKVTVHLDATNRRVDLLSEALDLAIRVRPPPLQDSDLVMRVLADRGQCLVASPALIQHMGFPMVPADLNGKPSLGVGSPQESYSWTLFGPNDAEAAIHHTPRFVTTDMIALRNAALAGIGIVQLPLMMLHEELRVGSLVKVVPEWTPRREIVHVVFPSRRGLLPSVRMLIDYLAERFAALHED